jgi:hypothetical protein
MSARPGALAHADLVPALELPGQRIVRLIARPLPAQHARAGLVRRIDIARYAARGRRIGVARPNPASGRRRRDQGEEHGFPLHPEILLTTPTTAAVRAIQAFTQSCSDRGAWAASPLY